VVAVAAGLVAHMLLLVEVLAVVVVVGLGGPHTPSARLT
jgi:hypothetical protein